MSRIGKVVVLVFLISSLGMINLPSATADGVVDQSNTPGIVAILVPIGTAAPVIVQTFTPTTPDIVAVDIFLQGGDAGVLLDIFIVDNVGSQVFVESVFNPGCPCSGLIAIHLDFTGVQFSPLTTGSTNTIGMQHSSTSSDAVTDWAGSAGSAYAPGSALYTGASAGEDFFFVTFGPIPSGGIGVTMDLLAGCILTVNTVTTDFGSVAPPASGVAFFNFQNDGTATQVISADFGDDITGGMQDATAVTILPADITVGAGTGFDATPTATMLNTGTPVLIANLQPFTSAAEASNARVGTITAATTNLQNLPASGALTGILTVTGGACA